MPPDAERTQVFLLPLSAAGAGAALPATDIERAEADILPAALRAAFLVRRRLLRQAVALRLGIAAGDILIARDANGAPRVTSAREPVFVSLAWRGELVAVAVSDRPVGIDVEAVEATPPEPALNVLHPSERDWLARQTAHQQPDAFLRLWCVKEAYLKATGLGLRREPAEIAVSLVEGGDVCIEDAGRRVQLDTGFVARTSAHAIPAILACIVLAR